MNVDTAIPLRVLFVSGTPLGTATCRYRCEHLAEALGECGASAEVVYIGQPRVRVDHDVVVLYRVCATAEGRRFARAARASGASLVYSTDDIVFDADEAPPQMGKRFRALAPLHREMLAEADAALASTDYLADCMRKVAPETPVYTVRNFLGSELMTLSAAARQSAARASASSAVTLGYLSGSPTHDEDFGVIAEPLRRILAANTEAELCIVGPLRLPPILLEFETVGRVRRLAPVGWRTLPALVAEQGIRINLAPLDLARRFCHAKSEVKYLEAAALAIPTVASAAQGFQEAISTTVGENGCFFASIAADWEQSLNFLIQQERERRQHGLRALEYAASHGTPANMAGVTALFTALATLRGAERTTSGPTVNWPFSVRYALKSAVERGRALVAHRRP
ncbi:MAG: glycosyltransferase [Armatimonadota bacterium]